MVAVNDRIVTVLGGTDFGRRVVRHLRKREFSVRIASRHPDRGHKLFGLDDSQLQSVEANIHDERSMAETLAGVYDVVNAVSLHVEYGQQRKRRLILSAVQKNFAICALIRPRNKNEGKARLAHWRIRRQSSMISVSALFGAVSF
jgi:uncharacterized protein YbjT (DUF2867 family)